MSPTAARPYVARARSSCSRRSSPETGDAGSPRAAGRSGPRTRRIRMSDLVAVAYPDLDTARQGSSNLGQAQKAHIVELGDLVIVDPRGGRKVKLPQPSLAGAGAAGGALWGGLIGLIFF